MEKLRTYLNALSLSKQKEFAFACNTSIGYLRKAISVKPLLNAATCISIERASNKIVTRMDLRPHDWHLIWPELSKQVDLAQQLTSNFTHS